MRTLTRFVVLCALTGLNECPDSPKTSHRNKCPAAWVFLRLNFESSLPKSAFSR